MLLPPPRIKKLEFKNSFDLTNSLRSLIETISVKYFDRICIPKVLCSVNMKFYKFP